MASRDPRFQSNPLVTEPPDIRFYAGVPLALAPGVNIGTLCIIDRQAGEIDDDGLRRLRLVCTENLSSDVAVMKSTQDGA
jgi:GAF domain-containing protein